MKNALKRFAKCCCCFAKCSAANHFKVYRIKVDKVFQKLLPGTINLFVLVGNLCILEISQKKEFLEWGI